MKERRLVDTNIVIRFLVRDHDKHAVAAGRLFAACERGELVLVMLPEVLAECVFVLGSFYKFARKDIQDVMSRLISSPGIEIGELAVHMDTLARYGASNLHFVDCTLAAHAAASKLSVATFDLGFRKFGDVRVEV